MEFQFRVSHFGALYLAIQADPDIDHLREVVVQVVYYKLCSSLKA
jgi:hypothetical protein